MSIAVYTSLVGDFDEVHQGHQLSDEVDYFIFSDQEIEPQDGWTLLPQPDFDPMDDRRASRVVKIDPFRSEILSSYTTTIYIDASMEIVDRYFYREFLSYMDSDLLLSPHPQRNCAYDELDVTAFVDTELNQAQVESYRRKGFPEDFGLYEAGMIGRTMQSPWMEELSELWLDQVVQFSQRDQPSLSYCLWRLGIEPSVLPKCFWWHEEDVPSFEWFRYHEHRGARHG